MEEMEFFDVKTKNKFKTTEYRVEQKGPRFFVVAKSPTGSYECWKVVSKEKGQALKK